MEQTIQTVQAPNYSPEQYEAVMRHWLEEQIPRVVQRLRENPKARPYLQLTVREPRDGAVLLPLGDLCPQPPDPTP